MNTSEYLEKVKKFLTYEIRETLKSGAAVSESHFIDRAVDHIKRLYYQVPAAVRTPFRSRIFGESMDQSKFVNTVWKEIRPEVERHVADTVKQCRSRLMVKEIRQVAAKAQIEEAMDGTGLKYLIIPQTYRAKVAVRLGQRNKVIFYISYKRTAEDLERCISSVQALVKLIDSLGTGASIQKMMPYENW